MLKFSFKLLLIIFIPLTVFSQNSEPEPFYFNNWDSSNYSALAPLSKSYFHQNKIIKGFQWFGDFGFNTAMNMNSKVGGGINYNYEDFCDPDTTALSYDEPLNAIQQPGVCHNMVGMQYEPTLPLDGTNEGTILRPDDPA